MKTVIPKTGNIKMGIIQAILYDGLVLEFIKYKTIIIDNNPVPPIIHTMYLKKNSVMKLYQK